MAWTVVGILIVASLLIGYLSFKLKEVEKKRREYLEKLKSSESVPSITESPHDQKKFIRNAAKAISDRFQVIRRFVIPLVVLFALLLGSIPFLDGVARSYASLMIGVVTVVLGFAARPFIENVISGLLLLVGKSIKAGDTVLIDNHYGTVEEIQLTYTAIKIWDWRRYIVPNSEFLKKAFINYSYRDQFVWTRVEFRVSLDTDIELVRNLARDSMKTSESLASNLGDPVFWIMEMEKEDVLCWIVGWTESPEMSWNVSHDTRLALLKAFKKHKIKGQLSNLALQDLEKLKFSSAS